MKFKSLFLACLALGAAAFTLTGCGSTANLTTMDGQTAATVDNAGSIEATDTITAANVPAGETVGAITGTSVTLTLPASVSSTASATFKPSATTVLNKVGTIAGDVVTDVEQGAVTYMDAETALTAAQQAMGGHGVSVQNVGTYALAESSAANSSGLGNAAKALETDIANQISAGTPQSQIVNQLTVAQTAITPTTGAQ